MNFLLKKYNMKKIQLFYLIIIIETREQLE